MHVVHFIERFINYNVFTALFYEIGIKINYNCENYFFKGLYLNTSIPNGGIVISTESFL